MSRLGFAILLKCYQYLGRPIKAGLVNAAIKKHIAKQLSIDPNIDLTSHSKSTIKNHRKAVRDYLEISNDRKKRRVIMKQANLDSAQTKENLADIINRVIEEIFRQRFKLLAHQSLVRLARAARTVANNGHYRKISDVLTKNQKQLIVRMLESNDDKAEDELTWLDLK